MTRPHIAILGAGPTGLEAALTAAEEGCPFTLYEAAPTVAGNLNAWGHVRLFSPWSLDVSPRMRRHLTGAGLEVPDGDACPLGAELAAKVLEPLARLRAVAPNLRLGTRVQAIARQGLLKQEAIGSAERARRPFRLLLSDATGQERVERAEIVLDCSGGYAHPNPLGDGGVPAPGERKLAARISRRIPDLAADGEAWRGRTILLAGAGHSAQTAADGLARLAEDHPGTHVLWALRRPEAVWPAPDDDPLPERSRLARRANALGGGASPHLEAIPGVVVDALTERDGKLEVTLRDAAGEHRRERVDRVLALTGSVGDHQLYRQLQVHECYATSGPMKLAAALLGAGGGDCLAQSSHGAETLVNPEPGFFILGAKSYGRNNTFLMRVGWQQVDEVFGLLRRAGG